MNQVTIFGNLGADPELKMSASGMGVLKLRVATSERVKKGEEWQDHTEWHSVTLFGKRAEGLAKILAKGDKVLVSGKLRTSSYEKNGEKRYSTEIIGDDVFLGGSKRSNADGEERPARQQSAPSAPAGGDDFGGDSRGDDEIPFASSEMFAGPMRHERRRLFCQKF